MARRPDAPEGERGDDVLLTHRRLLGHRLYVHCWVRAGVAVTLVAAGLFARHALGMRGVDVGALSVVAACIAAYDVVAWLLLRRYRDPEVATPEHERLLLATYGAIALDFVALTCAVWLVGGIRSPFAAFYLLHVIVSALLLSRRAVLVLTGLAYGLLVLLAAGEWTGLAPPRLPAGAVASVAPLEGRFALTLLVVYAMLFGLTCFLLLGLTRSLRRGERRIYMANAELGRLSEQRRDFLHIAMHNLKAPLGAVKMFLENLQAGLAGPLNDKQGEWVGRSLRRLDELSDFMSDMHTLSSLESDIIAAQFTRVDLEQLLARLVEEHRDLAEQRGQSLRLEVRRPVPPVVGHPRLLREAAVNYLTNALRYTPAGGHVEVRLAWRAPHVRLEVADDGEGIAPADQARLFGEFVRLRKPAGPGEPERGSGLGLSIVKRIALAHGGRVGVDSEPGRGSTFFLELPPLLE